MRNLPTRRPGMPEPPRQQRERRPSGPGLLGWLQRLAVGAVLAGLIGWVLLFYVFAPELPDPRELRVESEQPTITVLASDGSTLASRGTRGARYVELKEISPFLVKAVIATEDARFWRHFGVDVFGLARATLANFRAGGIVEGGSTITQQLVKNLYLNNERSFRRKLEELVYAIWLETQLKKEQILTIYLNRVYFGAGAFGVEAAAQRYFAKPARDVSLPEAAMIAGLLKAPSRYAPTNDLDQARDRATVVLERMVDAGLLTAEEALSARMRPARVAPDAETVLAGHFVDWALNGLQKQLGEADRDLVVRTTIDPAIQKAAQGALDKIIGPKSEARGATQAAVVVLDMNGAIRAMVGGRSYRQSAFNRATDARRQPGSAFKPFVYLAALEEGLAPETVYTDRPVRIGDWEPRNYSGKYLGNVTAAQAFAESINTVAVLMSERTGRKKVVEMARRLGITSPLEPVPSLALGTFEVSLLELTSAYQPIAAGGVRRPAYGVSDVADAGGRSLYRHEPSEVRVIERRTDALMQELMVGVVENGTGRAAKLGERRAAGKTGTTNAARDAWFVGFSGDYIAGVWVGNDEAKPMKGVSGSTIPAYVWKEVMLATPKPAPFVAQVDQVPEVVRQTAENGLDWLLDVVEKTFGRLTQ
jgi:penicillin-binding protein 1A